MKPPGPKDRLGELTTEEKRKLLRGLLTRKLAAASEYPLSYGQKALWFLQKLDADMAAYNVVISARCSPALDRQALERAFQRLAALHEILQTTVDPGEAELGHKRGSAAIPVQFLERFGSTTSEIKAQTAADSRRPFVLEREPPIRASIYCLGHEDVLLIAAHHLAFDAWSAQVLLEDLRAFYEAETGASAAGEPSAAVQYRDFVLWQRRMLEGEGRAHWEYWSGKLSGKLPVLCLPSQNPRHALNSFTGGSIPIALDSQVLNGLRSLAKEQRVTLFVVLLAAWASLLALLSGDEEIIVGVPVSGRTRPEWSRVIGYFINTLPIRLRVSPQKSFVAHLRDAADTSQEAMGHQDYPFPLIVERLKVRRDSIRTPVFQTLLNVHRAPAESDLGLLYLPESSESVRFGPNRLRPYPLPQQEGQFDLVLELMESKESLTGNVKFSHDILSPEEAARVTAQFRSFVREAARHPDKPVGLLGSASALRASADLGGDRDEIDL